MHKNITTWVSNLTELFKYYDDAIKPDKFSLWVEKYENIPVGCIGQSALRSASGSEGCTS
jgi:hypothetical protein